jgi:hypothetical protein
MKACWESGGIAPRILDLGTRFKWMVRFTPRPGRFTSQGKSSWYPLDRRLDGPQSHFELCGEEKNSQGREADHSHPSSAEVKEWVELYIHSPNTPSWRGA